MKIFVTGVSGFVGGALCQHINGQHELLGMARSKHGTEKVRNVGATPIFTELGKVTVDQLRGIDVIVHCAARVESYGDWEQFHETNVLGTMQLLDVAKQAGVKRFVHVGTEAAVFKGQDLVNIDEEEPYALDSPYPYPRSKALAEQAVLEADDADFGFTTISIRPCKVWGPGDDTIIKEVAEMQRKGAFTWINQGHNLTSSTHIYNLVFALELAIASEKHGEAYFVVDDEQHTCREFLTRYLATQGIELSNRSFSSTPLMLIASVVKGIWRIFGLDSKPPISKVAVAMVGSTCTINDEKSRIELAYSPVISFDEGLAAMPRLGL